MTSETAELVRLGYEVWNQGNLDAWLDLLEPDVETVFAAGPDASVYRGHEGVRQWFREGLEAWDGWGRMDPEEMDVVGDRILVSVRWRVRGRSGVEVETQQWHVITLREGRLARIEFHVDEASAREAAAQR
jgi:ketosteroid isomerase-like protein